MDEPQDTLPKAEHHKVVRRAAAAYLADPEGGPWPDEVNSGVERHSKLNYVVLRDHAGKVLATYRLRRGEHGQLKRLWSRIPDGVE